jgi:ATP-dependent DNA helicase RecG
MSNYMMLIVDAIELTSMLRLLRRSGDDGQAVEAKRARHDVPKDIWETISAFANGQGGRILLGVDERQGFAISGVSDPAAAARRIADICSQEMEPPVRASVAIVDIDEERVVVATIPPTPRNERPCHRRSDGPMAGSRLRVHDGNRRLTEYEVALLLAERRQPEHDRRPVTEAGVGDLNLDSVDAYLERMRAGRPRFRSTSRDELLAMLNVVATTGTATSPTLAGLLVFGTYPQRLFPQLDITVVVLPHGRGLDPPTGAPRFLDNASLDGPIDEMVEGALAVVLRNLPHRGYVDGLFRRDEPAFPVEAIREAIVNAVVHRDYGPWARGTQVQIEIYRDGLLVRNPGGLYGPIGIESLGRAGVTSARNEALLKLLEVAIGGARAICENRGSGIIAMRRSLAAAGLPPPVFEDDVSTFSVWFSNESLLDQATLDWFSQVDLNGLSASQRMGLALARRGVELSNSSYREATGVTDSRQAGSELRRLVDRGLLVQTGARGSARYSLGAVSTPPVVGTIAERILAVLGATPMRRIDIATRIGAPNASVAGELVRLRKLGRVELVGAPRSRTAMWRRVDVIEDL